MKYLRILESVPFKDEQFSERGERVYTMLQITVHPPEMDPIKKVIEADPGLGFTEEWIEDTVQGALEKLALDFPNDVYTVKRMKPNVIDLEYAGVRGVVN